MEFFQNQPEIGRDHRLLDHLVMEGGDVYTPQAVATVRSNTDTVLMMLESTDSSLDPPLTARFMHLHGNSSDAEFQLQVFRGNEEMIDERVRAMGARFENLNPFDNASLPGLSDTAAKVISNRKVALQPIYVARREDVRNVFGIGGNRVELCGQFRGISLISEDGQKTDIIDKRDGTRQATFVGPTGLQMVTVSGPVDSLSIEPRAGGRYVLNQSSTEGVQTLVISTAHRVDVTF